MNTSRETCRSGGGAVLLLGHIVRRRKRVLQTAGHTEGCLWGETMAWGHGSADPWGIQGSKAEGLAGNRSKEILGILEGGVSKL